MFLSPLTNTLMVVVLFAKLHLLASLLKMVYACGMRFLFLLLYLHKMGYKSVNIGYTDIPIQRLSQASIASGHSMCFVFIAIGFSQILF